MKIELNGAIHLYKKNSPFSVFVFFSFGIAVNFSAAKQSERFKKRQKTDGEIKELQI